MEFIGTWIATAIATAVATWLLPGFVVLGDQLVSVVVFSLFIALINAGVRPLMRVLSLPLTIVTLGFFHLVVNAAALMLASWLALNLTGVGVYITGFWSAFVGSIIISIVSSLVGGMLGND